MVGTCIKDYKVPPPSGYALGVADFIIHNALPTMQYLLHKIKQINKFPT